MWICGRLRRRTYLLLLLYSVDSELSDGACLRCRSGISCDVPSKQLDSWNPGYHFPGNIPYGIAALLAVYLSWCTPGEHLFSRRKEVNVNMLMLLLLSSSKYH